MIETSVGVLPGIPESLSNYLQVVLPGCRPFDWAPSYKGGCAKSGTR